MDNIDSSILANIIILLFAIYHISVGIPSMLSFPLLRHIGNRLYSLNIPESVDPKYEFTLKPIGCYALTVGFFCLLELFNNSPKQKAIFLLILSFLLVSRAWGRWFYKALFEKAFQVNWQRSRKNVLFNLICSVISCCVAYFLYFS